MLLPSQKDHQTLKSNTLEPNYATAILSSKLLMSPVQIDIDGPVATVSLNRPNNMNTVDLEMARSLYHISLKLCNDESVRAVIITGIGDKSFCAGGDLSAFAMHSDSIGNYIQEVTHYLHEAIICFARMNAPVITAINGVTAGAGIAFLGFPQLVLASNSACFVSAYTKAGLTPDGSSTWFLPRLIGMRRTQEFIFTNRMLSANEALEWGLINQVLDAKELLNEARKKAHEFAVGPRMAYGRIKDLLNNSFSTSIETQMKQEALYLSKSAQSVDGQTGITNFLSKSKSHFTD